jgi:hypothetical protein
MLQLLDELVLSTVSRSQQPEPVWNLHRAVCQFYLGKRNMCHVSELYWYLIFLMPGMYKEAYDTALKTGSGLSGAFCFRYFLSIIFLKNVEYRVKHLKRLPLQTSDI